MGLLALLLALVAVPASASAKKVTISYFKTPSGNIVCMYAAGLAGTQPFLDCAIKSGLKPPPPRVKCREGDPTDLFVDLGRTGRPHRPSCAGDPGPLVGEKQAQVLKYGHKFHHRGLRCGSAVKGLTCRNVSGHGFFLSREHSRVF
ncbi:MAG TPA: DUF6636 domain-containing protein [Thermoleophilaceae bacterium]